ncbi:LysR family transcriptional regulator [Nocardia nova]|uniref:LysR family transcriptional regulator n=1 Tax=Nocardia nova TaxID=37330 RepID=UPI00340A7AE6
MEVVHLRAFLAVAEELHFRRAAERLHIAQPPLTRTIKLLERELGTPLFDRNTRSVSLTPSGRALVEPAREVIEALRRAAEAARSAERGEVGLVRIAFAGVSTHPLVASLARSVRSERPGIELELSSQNFALPTLERLAARKTDIALGRWDMIPDNIDARVVMTDGLVLALPATHALAADDEVGLGQLQDERFVSLPPHEGSVLTDRLGRLGAAQRFMPTVVQIAPDTQTALALVSAEVGCLLTLASVAATQSDPHVSFVRLAATEARGLPDVHLRAAWRADERGPAVLAVRDALVELTD